MLASKVSACHGSRSCKAVTWFPHICNAYLFPSYIKWLSSVSSHFAQKYFWHVTSSCICSIYLPYVCTVSDGFIKTMVHVDFQVYALTGTNTTLIKKIKTNKKTQQSSKRCHSVKTYFNSIKFLNANVKYIYIVYAKYQIASIKGLIQVAFPPCMHCLSTNKTLMKQNVNNGQVQNAVIPSNITSHQTSSCKCSMCLHCVCRVSDGRVCRVSDGFNNSSGTS